ncbi:hypothetical protein CMO87_03000 [Candidatus Woesearchaeota archaeon]|nr:hypothetical protein [Candidatus Woesearchaeota archaeon]
MLLTGTPRTGKTIIALQFIYNGAKNTIKMNFNTIVY